MFVSKENYKACLVVFGTERFLIPAMLLITLILTLLRKRKEQA